MTITIYGIKNCDTMKKARAFLDKQGVAYDFHDYKTKGIERGKLEGWVKKALRLEADQDFAAAELEHRADYAELN